MRTPYPVLGHCLSLVPAIILLVGIRVFIGPEDAVYQYFTGVRAANPSWTMTMEVFSNGSLVLFYPLYAIFLVRGLRRRRFDDVLFVLCYVTAQVLIAALLCRVVKIAVGRPRPMTGGPFVPFSFGWGYQSFPSGHTGEIMGSVVPLIWRFGGPSSVVMPLAFGLLIAAVAFSRLYLSMHHPTDILGGLVFGSLSGYASWVLFHALRPRMKNWLERNVQGVGP